MRYPSNTEFWPTVYAADPVYRYNRSDGPEPLPIERAAAEAARQSMIDRGILVA